MKELKVEITFVEEMLGTKAADTEVFATYIANKAKNGEDAREEIDVAEEAAQAEESGSTIFHKQDGRPVLWDYQIKGFMKDAASALNRMSKADTGLDKLTAYKTKIDSLIFVTPRLIVLELPQGIGIGTCERPLRADTAQGPRVALCRSETVPAGTVMRFSIQVMNKDLIPYVRAWLKYGALRGIGQWRNSGKGRFSHSVEETQSPVNIFGIEAEAKKVEA